MARVAAAMACVAVLSAGALAQQPTGTSGGAAPVHMLTPSALTWSPAPGALPSGAELAVMDGDPGSSGPFTIRLKMPAGYRIPPHWHPTDENITVIEGTLLMGMGDQMSEDAAKPLGVGAFAKMPQNTHHFAMAKGPTVLQIHGPGPFQITYVNPSDDPRNKQ